MAKARLHLAALGGYGLLAVLLTWPLVANLSTHVLGPIDGDTGVYIWNQWVFRHELLTERSNPYYTDQILALTPPENLSLHNYTTFANLLALPLIGVFGVVTTFNVTYLLMVVLTAYSMFVLARHVTTGATAAAWLAGALFAWAPTMVGRSMGHFSLASAAALPLFVLFLLRVHRLQRFRDATGLGVATAIAAATDVYYGVFCLIIAAIYIAVQATRISRDGDRAVTHHQLRLALDVAITLALATAAAIAATGGGRFTVAGQAVSLRGLYTPMLIATVLVAVRLGWRCRATIIPTDGRDVWQRIRLAAAAVVVTTFALSPVLYGLAEPLREGRLDDTPVFWRSSPGGIDLAALLLPNPNHPLAPEAWRQWLTTAAADSYMENIASIPLVAVAVMLLAYRRGWRPAPVWTVFAIGSGLLAIGPFLHVAHINTYIPGPWAVLRYLPVLGLVRSPGRFMVLVLLAVAVLFAVALVHVTVASAHRRRIVTLTGVLLLVEILPAPRTLYSAELPPVYARIATDRRDVRILELPAGIRDGRAMVGIFSARSQFYQTYHEKPLVVGGLLSRVPRQRVALMREDAVVDILLDLSAGVPLSDARRAQLFSTGPMFGRRANVGYVVIDRLRAGEELRKIAPIALDLQFVTSDGHFDLYRPRVTP